MPPVVKKWVRRDAPYIEQTFSNFGARLVGRSGLLSGGRPREEVSTQLTLEPFSFVQGGLVVEVSSGFLGGDFITVPSIGVTSDPVFVLVSSPDNSEASGVSVIATTDLSQVTQDSVVVAVRLGGIWTNPPVTSTDGAIRDVREIEANLAGGRLDGGDLRSSAATNAIPSVRVRTGRTVNARGEIYRLGTGLSPVAGDEHIDLAHGPQDAHLPRNNYYLVRSPDGFPGGDAGVERAIGGTVSRAPYADNSVTAAIDVGPIVSRPALLTGAGSGHAYVVWTKSNKVRFCRVDNDAANTVGVAATDVFTSGGVFDGDMDVAVAFESGGSIVIAFIDTVGAQRVLKLMSISVGGVVVDAAVDLTSVALPNQARRPRMVIDENDVAHIVIEHNITGVRKQIYYVRCGALAGDPSFGQLLGGTPKIVCGADDLGNDTHPTIALNRRREIFVAYAKGSGTDEFGDIVLCRLDKNGNFIDSDAIATGSTASASAASSSVAYSTVAAMSRQAMPRVVITPQDDVYVVFSGNTSADLQKLWLWNASFLERFRGKAIDLFATTAAFDVQTVEAFADDLGCLVIAYARDTGLPAFRRMKLDTVIAPRGILVDSILAADTGYTPLASKKFSIVKSHTGAIKVAQLTNLGSDMRVGTVSSANTSRFTPHPRDVILGSWAIPEVAKAIDTKSVRMHPTRPARLRSAVLVGRDGDLVGFDSLMNAIETAGGSALPFRLTPGVHLLGGQGPGDYTFTLGSLEILGGPGARVLLDESLSAGQQLSFVGKGAVTVSAASAGVLTIASTAGVFPGDTLVYDGRTTNESYYTVMEIISSTQLRVGPSTSTTGAAQIYSSVRFREIDFLSTLGALFSFGNMHAAIIERCSFANIGILCSDWRRGHFLGNYISSDLGTNIMSMARCEGTTVQRTEARTAALGVGMVFDDCSRLIVTDNIVPDDVAIPYKVLAQADFAAWSNNVSKLGPVQSTYWTELSDTGRLVNENIGIRALNIHSRSVDTQRLNGGSYDSRLALLASELDSLKDQNSITTAFGVIVNFDDIGSPIV